MPIVSNWLTEAEHCMYVSVKQIIIGSDCELFAKPLSEKKMLAYKQLDYYWEHTLVKCEL